MNGAEIRRRTGVLTETPALYERLSAMQNLHFFGTMADLEKGEIKARSKLMLEVFGLTGRADDRVDTFSKGMKQRLAIARAMLHDPELLFLDEPTSDLDPEAARQVGDTIREISEREKRTVILCTHRLFEAEQVCDRVAIMKKGQVMASGRLDDLRQALSPQISIRLRIAAPFSAEEIEWLKNLREVSAVELIEKNEILLKVPDEAATPMVVAYFVNMGASVLAVEPKRASLEDIYLHLQQNARKENA
jgi:ABC-2 type transport system ATP-binding protein